MQFYTRKRRNLFVNVVSLIDILANPVDGAVAPAAEHLAALRDYRAQYGVTASL